MKLTLQLKKVRLSFSGSPEDSDFTTVATIDSSFLITFNCIVLFEYIGLLHSFKPRIDCTSNQTLQGLSGPLHQLPLCHILVITYTLIIIV